MAALEEPVSVKPGLYFQKPVPDATAKKQLLTTRKVNMAIGE